MFKIRAVLAAAGVVLVAMAWLTAAEALATMHRVSNMMRWPHYPFQFVVAFGAAMYALVLFIQSFRMVRKTEGSSQNVPR